MLKLLLALAMAFPVPAERNSQQFTSGTSKAVNYPATKEGKWCLNFQINVAGAGGVLSTTEPGWSKRAEDTSNDTTSCWEKNLDGTEGATVTFTHPTANTGSVTWERVTGADETVFSEVAVAAGGPAAPANPPSLTPSGGAKDYLWLAAGNCSSGATFNAAPTNYTNFHANNGTRPIAHASRQLNAATEDPGPFTESIDQDWGAATWAIPPAIVPTAELTGTATAGIDETDITAGGKTLVLTVTGDEWIP